MEPWVHLPCEANFIHYTREDMIAENQGLRQTEKHRAFQFTFDMLKENGITGDYFEFGCHRVRTFRMALSEARKRDLSDMHFWAFDSFEGLPQLGTQGADHPLWVEGALHTSLEEFDRIINSHGIYVNQVHTIKGFYSESLNAKTKNYIRDRGRMAAFINIDCDLYESALDALSFVCDFLQEGTVIYMDDLFAGYKSNIFRGVGAALNEFERQVALLDWVLVPHMQVGWWGRTYIVSRKA